jgi:hypothetical protein
MKKFFVLSSLLFLLASTSCGPAAEDRQKMHERAKVFQDSIANFIRVSMAEAEAPGPGVAPAVQQNTAIPQPTPGQPQPVQPITPNVGVNQHK